MWPPEALEFLRELEANNDREWFRTNRSRYDDDLVEPARALADELRDLGAPRFFRPYNDTRFHARPPIKERLAVVLGHIGAGGFYFELSLDGLFVAAGLHAPASDQLDRYRRAVDDGRRAASLERAIRTAERGGLELAPPQLKRAPRGYPPDHRRIDRLRMKELTVYRGHELGPWLHTRECTERVGAQMRAARPFVRWLGEHVGPSSRNRA
jgi:uncharacterized protein (TIGR02453 family)